MKAVSCSADIGLSDLLPTRLVVLAENGPTRPPQLTTLGVSELYVIGLGYDPDLYKPEEIKL